MPLKCAKDKQKEDSLPENFYRRIDGRSTNYYVRLTAPTILKKWLPKIEWEYRASTGTADRKRALTVGAAMIARKRKEWQDLLDSLQASGELVTIQLTEQLIQQIAGAWLNSWIETDVGERQGPEGISSEQLKKIEAFCKYSDAKMRSVLAQGRASSNWSHVVEEVMDWCSSLGYEVNQTDPLFPNLVRAFAKAERNAQDYISKRNRGEEPLLEQTRVQIGTCLSAMTDDYAEHKSKSVAKKTVSKNLSIWRRFVDFRGDVFFDEVTTADIYRFLEDRLHTKKEPWSQSYVDGHAKRALKEIFALARTLGHMTVPNPVLNLESTPKLAKSEQQARKKPRFPFSPEQINTLLKSEWYDPKSTSWRGKIGKDLAVRYWAPLIALLHGPRVREYMQLLTSDVVTKDGVLCFSFKVELDDSENSAAPKSAKKGTAAKSQVMPARSLKNESVVRTIPIHPKLIALGFADFVRDKKKGHAGGVPLFDSALPEPGGITPIWGRAFEQGFVRYVRDTLGFGNGFGTHSFRHSFEDRIRDSQAKDGIWPAGLAQFLTGRKLPRDADSAFFRQEGSERSYGAGYKPSALYPYLQRLQFKDIKFPAPFSEWRAKTPKKK